MKRLAIFLLTLSSLNSWGNANNFDCKVFGVDSNGNDFASAKTSVNLDHRFQDDMTVKELDQLINQAKRDQSAIIKVGNEYSTLFFYGYMAKDSGTGVLDKGADLMVMHLTEINNDNQIILSHAPVKQGFLAASVDSADHGVIGFECKKK